MRLYGGAVKRPIMTTLCFVTVVILGIFSLAKLPIDLYPDIDTNTLMVITMYPGASAEDIEQNVTKPLENILNSVEHLKHITSASRENTSVITLEFEYGYDIDVLTNDVRDKLDMVKSSLPDDSENPIIFTRTWPTPWRVSTAWERSPSPEPQRERYTYTWIQTVSRHTISP